MNTQAATTITEAGLKPASLAFSLSSANTLTLCSSTFLGTMFIGLAHMFLSAPGNRDMKTIALFTGPILSHLISAFLLHKYKLSEKQKFKAFVETKMQEIDLKISLLPKKRSVENYKTLEKLENKRTYWEDMLYLDECAQIDVD